VTGRTTPKGGNGPKKGKRRYPTLDGRPMPFRPEPGCTFVKTTATVAEELLYSLDPKGYYRRRYIDEMVRRDLRREALRRDLTTMNMADRAGGPPCPN
jgi:hypothetical protein